MTVSAEDLAFIQDRCHRIRSALLVYVCIAIDKIPAWSNFGSTLIDKGAPFTRQTLGDLNSFDGLVEDRTKVTRATVKRLKQDLSSLQELDPKAVQALPESFMLPREPEEFLNQLRDGMLDKAMDLTDQSMTGGLLNAMRMGCFDQQRLLAFHSVASIDWENAFPRPGSPRSTNVPRLLRSGLQSLIKRRLEILEWNSLALKTETVFWKRW